MSRPWLRRAAGHTLIATALVGGALAATASTASASTTTTVAWTNIGIYPRVAPSMSSAHATETALSDDDTVTVICEQKAESVSNGYDTIAIWDRLDDGTWLPNAFLRTGTTGWTPGVPRCGQDQAPTSSSRQSSDVTANGYDRSAAAAWAVAHYQDTEHFTDEDCTWFASNALWAGGLTKTSDWTDRTHNPQKIAAKREILGGGPTKTTANPRDLVSYLLESGLASEHEITWSNNTAGGAQLGDLIAYDWDNGADGTLDHVAVVTKVDATGYPLRTQHTPARLNAGWSWDPQGNDWMQYTHKDHSGKEPKAYLIHIN